MFISVLRVTRYSLHCLAATPFFLNTIWHHVSHEHAVRAYLNLCVVKHEHTTKYSRGCNQDSHAVCGDKLIACLIAKDDSTLVQSSFSQKHGHGSIKVNGVPGFTAVPVAGSSSLCRRKKKTIAVSTTDGWFKLNFASCVIRSVSCTTCFLRESS